MIVDEIDIEIGKKRDNQNVNYAERNGLKEENLIFTIFTMKTVRIQKMR